MATILYTLLIVLDPKSDVEKTLITIIRSCIILIDGGKILSGSFLLGRCTMKELAFTSFVCMFR